MRNTASDRRDFRRADDESVDGGFRGGDQEGSRPKHIFVLPNNSNIILAAQQAAAVCEGENVHVIPSKSIPQGLCACIMFNPDVDYESNLAEMNDAITMVKTGQVTYAIKDTVYEGMEIVGRGLHGHRWRKSIVISTPNKMDACLRLLDSLIDGDSEIVTVLAGEDASEKRPRSPGTSKISSAWKRISRPAASLSTRLSSASNKSKGQYCKHCKAEV